MSKIKMFNIAGDNVGDITLTKEIWDITPNETCVYDAVNLARASLRQGTHKTKTRGEVRGGGRKPWRQKGTGRARQGSIRSPQWPGGGIVFGPTPRDYSKKMNRKERLLALKSSLAYKVIEKKVIGLDSLVFDNPKTKSMIDAMSKLKLSGRTLFIVEEIDKNVALAARNIGNVAILETNEFGILDIMSTDNLVVTKGAVKKIGEVLS